MAKKAKVKTRVKRNKPTLIGGDKDPKKRKKAGTNLIGGNQDPK